MLALAAFAAGLSLAAAAAAAGPNTCQPRSEHPLMPIYHIIGNVTSDAATGKVTRVEAINDISSVILYKGIYHICAPPPRPPPSHPDHGAGI